MQQIRGEGFAVSARLEGAMTAGLEAMGAEAVEVIVTDAFDRTVRHLTGSITYRSDNRGTGGVVAKTLRLENRQVIVVNGPMLANHLDPTRALAHEAGHVLIYRRNETHEQWMQLIDSQGDYTLFSRGALALVDARIERSVIGLGFEPEGWVDPAELREALQKISRTVRAARQTGEVPPAVSDVFALLTTILGYLGGAAVAGIQLPLLELGDAERQLWDECVRPTWDMRTELYASVPTATEPSHHRWIDAFLQCRDLERQLLFDAGFQMHPDGRVG